MPTGAVPFFILLFCLNVPRNQKKTLKQHVREFDILGLLLIVGGIASILVGLNNGEKQWKSVGAIVPIALGAGLVFAGAINEIFTKQSPVIPPRLFKTRTTAALLGLTFFHGIAFFAGAYFIPLYFQILGSSALLAGVRGMTYSVGCSITSVVGGVLMAKIYRNYKVILGVSMGIMTAGFGAMIALDARSSVAAQELLILIPAIG